jgi:8-oxo-dGTP pyrophosphatase MutT (NUDIX family)
MKEKKIMTEALALRKDKILLGRRKKNGFGQGKWLGLGGKVEIGETIEQAMIRECEEEANIKVTAYIKRGVLTFYYQLDPDMEVHYFEILGFTGLPSDSEEMQISWFKQNKIPYDLMWPNDRYWLPMFLKKEYFEGEFHFDADYKIHRYNIFENKRALGRGTAKRP